MLLRQSSNNLRVSNEKIKMSIMKPVKCLHLTGFFLFIDATRKKMYYESIKLGRRSIK